MGACLSHTTDEITLTLHVPTAPLEYRLAPGVSCSTALSALKTVVTGAVYRRFGKQDVARFAEMMIAAVDDTASLQNVIMKAAEELVKDVPNGRPTFVYAYNSLYLRVDISSQLPVFSRKLATFVVTKKPDEPVTEHPGRYANPCAAEPVLAVVKKAQAPFIMPPPLFTGAAAGGGVEMKVVVVTAAQ